MSMYTNLLRSVALPAGSMLAGYRDAMPYLRGLEESQWWSPAELRALQERKLRRLVSHVYRNVPFYRRWMDEHGIRPKDVRTLDDLHLLPIVDKHVLVANFPDDLRDHSLPPEQLIEAASSGSTGETPLPSAPARSPRACAPGVGRGRRGPPSSVHGPRAGTVPGPS